MSISTEDIGDEKIEFYHTSEVGPTYMKTIISQKLPDKKVKRIENFHFEVLLLLLKNML